MTRLFYLFILLRPGHGIAALRLLAKLKRFEAERNCVCNGARFSRN